MRKRRNEEFNIKVSVENAYQVIGLNAWISYNPSIIRLVDASPSISGTQISASNLGFFPNSQLLLGIRKDVTGSEVPGTMICGYVSIPPTPVNGSGDCFTTRFRAIAVGSSSVAFVAEHRNLQNIDGDVLTMWVTGSVEVSTT